MEVLRSIVTESLIAFPEDAHLRVLTFLSSNGASESEKQRVEQAWSAVLLGSEAFGRKGKEPINPVLFGEEFLRELAAGDRELMRLEKMIAGFQSGITDPQRPAALTTLTSLADLKKPSGTLASLQSLSKAGRELHAALDATYERSEVGAGANGGDHHGHGSDRKVIVGGKDKVVMEWRRSVRGGKFVWHGRKSANASSLFTPLGSVEHGGVEISYGDIAFKDMDQAKESTKPTSMPVIGVKAVTKQPSLLSRAWTSYQCLHEVLSIDRRLQLFAAPYGIQRDSGAGTSTSSSAIMCVFDMPNCRPLSPLLGPALATFLRRYPSVILTWCAQLGSASRSLLSCSSGRLVRLPTLFDCFVKDNGQLLVGNVAFEAHAGNDENYGLMGSGTMQPNPNDISSFVVEVLSSSLSLSRRHNIALVPTAPFEVDTDGVAVTSGVDPAASVREDVVSVMEGCEVKLVFFDHSCRGVSLEIMGESDATPSAETSGGAKRLKVRVQGEAGVAALAHSGSTAAETYVSVKAMSAGFLMLHAVTPVETGSEASEKIKRMAAVRIVVVPAYPIMATELQEVVSLVNTAYTSGSKYLLQASSVVAPCQAVFDEIGVSNDWSAVTRAVVGIIDPAVTTSSTDKRGNTGSRIKHR